MFTSIRKNKHLLGLPLLLWLTSSCMTGQMYRETIQLPSDWNIEIESKEVIDPFCFPWWRAFEDPKLTQLVEESALNNNDVRLAAYQSKEALLQAVNKVASEVARNYIKLREAQSRLKRIEKIIAVQTRIMTLEEGLDKKLLSSIDSNESKINHYSLLDQRAFLKWTVEKIQNDLNLLVGVFQEDYGESELPDPPCLFPKESPCELMTRHPAVQEAKKIYQKAKVKQAFLHYKKVMFDVWNAVENSLSAISFSIDKYNYNYESMVLKLQSYLLTKDLFDKGLKDERELLIAYQQFLSVEDKFIESKAAMLTAYINAYESLSMGWQVD